MRVGFVVFPGFQMMSLAAGSVFEFANICAGETVYELATVSEHGGPVRSSTGMEVSTLPMAGEVFDTVLVGGGVGVPRPSDGLKAWIAARLPEVKPRVIVNRFEQQRLFSGGLRRADVERALEGFLEGTVTNNYKLVREAIDRGLMLDGIKASSNVSTDLKKIVLAQVDAA